MEIMGRKRDRSSDPPFCMQNKIHVNQHFLDSRDVNKMKKVHAKTIDMLFKGSKNAIAQIPLGESKDLTKLLILSGDGEIEMIHHEKPTDLMLRKRQSKCCDREVFIDAPCANCNVNLCEFCGYSCIYCGGFICNACITLFGCGTIEFPKCEKCLHYE